MKAKAIKKIGDRISKKWGIKLKGGIIVEKIKPRIIEARTELLFGEGGFDFMKQVKKRLGYESEMLGGCIYRFYKD